MHEFVKLCRRLLPACCLLLCLLGLAGCSRGGLKEDELFCVGDQICTENEAMIFVISQRSRYVQAYGEEIWSAQLSEGSFESYLKAALLDHMQLLYLADGAARAAGITLSEAEQQSVRKAAEQFLEALGEDGRIYTGITRELAEDAYGRYARAQIYYRQLLQEEIGEISDEEARVIRVRILHVPAEAGIGTAQQLLAQLEAGGDPEELLKTVTGAWQEKQTLSRGSSYGSSFDTTVFALKKDRWSSVLLVGEEYLLVQCLSAYEESDTAKNKAVLELESREALLQEALSSYAQGLTVTVNPVLWEKISPADMGGLPYADFYEFTEAFTKY